ncbi:uncharacterized protein IL334_007000 [Kwoniella shivajii]|uniref:Major facilitator superfamily (MFS) profile domain-containing protein n=1 Tax=Kwoniella shivajii TaxID=564305 RepID=A0ABZ1D8U3_9TREE|nr:hypothetical protein IL334_007000 [Kwoniella shivajii]
MSSSNTSKQTPQTPHSSIPSHLHPATLTPGSRSRSFGSRTQSPMPHEQQHNYVPSFDDSGLTANGITERALFSESESNNPTPRILTPAFDKGQAHDQDQDQDQNEQQHLVEEEAEEGQDEEDQQETEAENWDTIREGSIARRPKWRRPSPKWLYPFVIGVPLCLGMSMAPKAELYINLACLAHPPSASQDSTSHTHSHPHSQDLVTSSLQTYHNYMISSLRTGYNAGRPISADSGIGTNLPIGDDYKLTPSDKWFLKVQHDIYEYHLHHDLAKTNTTKPVPSGNKPISPGTGTGTISRPEPTSPLPRPDRPIPSKDEGESPLPSEEDDDDDENNHESQDDDKGHRPYREIDPRLCKRDVKVQGAAAKLTMIMTTTMGLLSALTTGFWGKTSDKLGRTKIIGLVVLGLFLNELCFVLVANFPYLVPGGYYFLLLGPMCEGFLGGYSAISATINAYISDVTPDGSRVTIFARIAGLFMAGFAVGPVLGSLLITWTGNIMTPFYINVIIYALYIPLVLFFLPESLSSEARMMLKKTRKLAREEAKKRDQLEREWEDETPFNINESEEVDPLLSGWSRLSQNISVSHKNSSKTQKKTIGKFKRFFRKIFGFLEPLSIFIPTEIEGTKQRNWNLTVVGLGLFCMSMVFGIMSIKAQYTFYAYGWTSAQLGPFMSLAAFSRSFVLIVLIPIVMHYVKPRFIGNTNTSTLPGHHPTIEEEAIEEMLGEHSTSPISTSAKQSNAVQDQKPKRSSHLDLLTVRVSLILETLPYIFLAMAPSSTGFVILSVLCTLGGSGNPAANSLALSLLPDPSQSGRLFGALSVLHACGANLISPLMFGTVFAATVGTYASTIFGIAAVTLILAQICFMFVKLDKKRSPQLNDNGDHHENENDDRAQSEEDGYRHGERDGRGRSRRVKRVNSSSLNGSGFSRTKGYGTMDDNTASGSTSGSSSGS